MGPFAGAHVEQRRARSVAAFHRFAARQPKIDVIVWQHNRAQPGVIFRFAFLQPENLRRGEARRHAVAHGLDGLIHTAERLNDLFAFGTCRSVAPELSSADDLIVCVERDEAVLLARNPYAAHAGAVDAQFIERGFDACAHGGDPYRRMLLLVACGQAFDQLVRLARARHDLAARGVEQYCFCALRAAVYADEIFAHLPWFSSFMLCYGCRFWRDY